MGKIFGISDLPVSTIMTALEPVNVPPVSETNVLPKVMETTDKFGSSTASAKRKVLSAWKTVLANWWNLSQAQQAQKRKVLSAWKMVLANWWNLSQKFSKNKEL